MSGWQVAGKCSASAQSVLKEDKRQKTLLATLAGSSLALATDFARQALSALVECSFRGSAFPTFPDDGCRRSDVSNVFESSDAIASGAPTQSMSDPRRFRRPFPTSQTTSRHCFRHSSTFRISSTTHFRQSSSFQPRTFAASPRRFLQLRPKDPTFRHTSPIPDSA